MGNNVGFLYKMLTISCVTLEYAELPGFLVANPPELPLCKRLRSIDCQSIAQHLHLSIAAIDLSSHAAAVPFPPLHTSKSYWAIPICGKSCYRYRSQKPPGVAGRICWSSTCCNL